MRLPEGGLPPWTRWVGLALALPSVFLVIGIAIFVARAELAHDEDSCPFEAVEARELNDDVQVREERRSCQPEVEERRWIVMRGEDEREVGRRRLASQFYSPEAYTWATELEDGVVLQIQNSGVESATFRENAPTRNP